MEPDISKRYCRIINGLADRDNIGEPGMTLVSHRENHFGEQLPLQDHTTGFRNLEEGQEGDHHRDTDTINRNAR